MITALQGLSCYARCCQCGCVSICEREGGRLDLYLRGSCFRMSTTEEIAYKPMSSVRMSTTDDPVPAPETAKKSCT